MEEKKNNREMNITINHIIETIALTTAIANYKKINGSRYVYFIPFLAFVLLGELGASYFYGLRNATKNLHIYLMIVVVECLFIGYQFYQIIKSKKLKKIIFIGVSILLLLDTIWLCFFEEIGNVLTVTMGLKGLFFSYVSSFCLYEKAFLSEQPEVTIFRNPDFWFSIGLLTFFVGTTIPFLLYYYFKFHDVLIFGKRIYNLFPQIFSLTLYSCYMVSIILWKKYQK